MATAKTAKNLPAPGPPPPPSAASAALPANPTAEPGCQFYDEERSDACLRGFMTLYEQQVLCDVTLVAQGQDFQCHRAMLAASSPYFQVRVCLSTPWET